MDVDCYRLAYNTFCRNWQRFGVPEKDIPFPKTEEVESLNLIIPGFSKAVAIFQITSRRELKTLFDECERVHNLSDFYTRFEKIMKEVFPGRFIVTEDIPKDAMREPPRNTVEEDLSKDAMMKVLSDVTMKEKQSEDTMDTYPSEDNTEEDLSEDSKKGSLSKDSKKESLSEDSKKESLSDDSKKESLSDDSKKESLSDDSKKESLSEDSQKDYIKIKYEEVPEVIAFSLAVCTELILYQYEDNKKYMKNMPDLWIKFFNENLKDLCDEAGCTSNYLKAYSETIRCPDNFLNKFVSENKNEYHNIEAKFGRYIAKNCAVSSPEHNKLITEVRDFPQTLSFAKMKAQFRAIAEICKSTKGMAIDEIPLLSDYSPSTPTSP